MKNLKIPKNLKIRISSKTLAQLRELHSKRLNTRIKRVGLYCEGIFKFASTFKCCFLEYKAYTKKPHSINLVPNSSSRMWGKISCLTVISWAIYWYFEICFGTMTNFEILLTLGLSSGLITLSTFEWFFVFSSNWKEWILVINSVLDLQFTLNMSPPVAYELICFVFFGGTPFLLIIFLPVNILLPQYFPAMYQTFFFQYKPLHLILMILV